MQLRYEIALAAMMKSMTDVVIPAVDGKNDLAVQQANLVVGLLNLLAQQLPQQFRFDRDELQRLLACAKGLSALRSEDPAIRAATAALDEARLAAESVYQRCATDPAELTAAVRTLREATGALVTASNDGRDAAALALVETAVMALSREQLLRDRALMLPQGWEPDPAAIPPIGTLLDADPDGVPGAAGALV